jgi:Holliday junction resolvase
MPSRGKIKGSGFEREVVDILREAGFVSTKMPLSGALSDYKGDVKVVIGSKTFQIECKRRRAGFKTLYGWLGDNDFLVFRDDRCEPLIAMRLKDFTFIMTGEK